MFYSIFSGTNREKHEFFKFYCTLKKKINKKILIGITLFWIFFSFKTANEEEKNITTRFSDVHGIDEFREELIEIVDYLKNPDKY